MLSLRTTEDDKQIGDSTVRTVLRMCLISGMSHVCACNLKGTRAALAFDTARMDMHVQQIDGGGRGGSCIPDNLCYLLKTKPRVIPSYTPVDMCASCYTAVCVSLRQSHSSMPGERGLPVPRSASASSQFRVPRSR